VAAPLGEQREEPRKESRTDPAVILIDCGHHRFFCRRLAHTINSARAKLG
jgi:hypothetical protein